MPDIVSSCSRYYLVASGDTCDTIVKKSGITLANFRRWNPYINAACTNLWGNALQPDEVRNVAFPSSTHHRHGPQQQQIRHGRDRTVVERLRGVDPFDAPGPELDGVNADAKSLRSIEGDLAVGFDAEVEGAGRGSLPDVDQHAGGRSNVHILRLLRRGVGNARSAAHQDELTTKLWPDEAGEGAEALDERLALRCGDGDIGFRHAARSGRRGVYKSNQKRLVKLGVAKINNLTLKTSP
ncbi:hypothetical protein VTK73DRAFT_1832 [Phialemonium thermophilum]|uniref:LysM domain-containing protein n=1 Tax=Phialemonium thermophilum TaxID=223376 RepID=A0ABR3VT26_9PEZI